MKKTLTIGLACALALGVMPLAACTPVVTEEEQLLNSLISESGTQSGEINLEVKSTASMGGNSARSSSKQQIIFYEDGADAYSEMYDGSKYYYTLSFAREEGTYSTKSSGNSFQVNYVKTMLNQLEQGELRVEFAEGETNGGIGGIDIGGIDLEEIESKAGSTLMRNVLLLCNGKAETTENGYKLKYKMDGIVEALGEELLPIAEAMDKNESLTVSQLLDGKGKSLFNRLLKDISAQEIYDLSKSGDIDLTTVTPKEKETAADYLRRFLKTEQDGEIPGKSKVTDALSDMGVSIDKNKKFKEQIEEFKENGADELGAMIMTALGVPNTDHTNIELMFLFDAEKQLTEFDAVATGSGNMLGLNYSATVKLEAKATASRSLADVTKFYTNGAAYFPSQTIGDAMIVESDYYIQNNMYGYSVWGEARYQITGDRLRVVIRNQAGQDYYGAEFNLEYTFDLKKQTERYECEYGTLTMTQSSKNEYGGYEKLQIVWNWSKEEKNDETSERWNIYCNYVFSTFKIEYEKVPVTR